MRGVADLYLKFFAQVFATDFVDAELIRKTLGIVDFGDSALQGLCSPLPMMLISPQVTDLHGRHAVMTDGADSPT